MAKSIVLNSGGFGGLDQRAGSSTEIRSLPHIVNFRVDESGALEKRHGYGVVGTIEEGQPISAVWHGILDGDEITFAACHGGVYALGNADLHFRFIGQTYFAPLSFFTFGNAIYCLGGDMYRCYGDRLESADGYTPLVATGCSYNGEGTVYEQANMLSNKRRVRFNGDGVNISYTLPEKNITGIVSVFVNGEAMERNGYTLIADQGIVEFNEPPSEGLNNVEVCYSVEQDYLLKSIITNCKYAVVFESRLFVFGNPDYPDRVYYSELADGLPSCEYFTEVGYHAFEKTVTSLVPCYNRLLIFFEDSACFTYSELKTDALGATYTSFPVYELHSSKGCIVKGGGCAYENTPVTLCRDGLNKWVSTAIADERSAVTFSHRAFRFINDALLKPDKVYMHNRKAKSELWVCSDVGTLIYNYALDCFYFYDLCNISSIFEYDNDLWLGLSDGKVCLFTKDCIYDGDYPIKAEFETPFCSFGSPYELKSLHGIELNFFGKGSVDAEISLKRGNLSENQESAASLSLPALKEEGYRRIKKRLHLKRFFSCKVSFSSHSDSVCVKELVLLAKQLGGGIRIN